MLSKDTLASKSKYKTVHKFTRIIKSYEIATHQRQKGVVTVTRDKDITRDIVDTSAFLHLLVCKQIS